MKILTNFSNLFYIPYAKYHANILKNEFWMHEYQ